MAMAVQTLALIGSPHQDAHGWNLTISVVHSRSLIYWLLYANRNPPSMCTILSLELFTFSFPQDKKSTQRGGPTPSHEGIALFVSIATFFLIAIPLPNVVHRKTKTYQRWVTRFQSFSNLTILSHANFPIIVPTELDREDAPYTVNELTVMFDLRFKQIRLQFITLYTRIC